MSRATILWFSGAALLLLGGAVAFGWWSQNALLVQVQPESEAMVLNTALGFALGGAALLLSLGERGRFATSTSALGCAMFAIAVVVLVEHLWELEVGIDWPSLHAWLHDSNTHPGRMSAESVGGFLMAGLAFAFAPYAKRPSLALLVRLSTVGVGAIGILGLAGHLLESKLLYAHYAFVGVAFHTSAGFLVLATGLRFAWWPYDWARMPQFAREDDRVTFVAAAVLAGIALAAGISSFFFMQAQVEALVRGNVLAGLQRRTEMFNELIAVSENNARIAASRPAVLRNLRAIRAGRDDGSNLANVRAVAAGFITQGFRAVAYFDVDGKVVASVGRFVEAPEMSVTLDRSERPQLLWHDGFILRHRIAMRDDDGVAGTVRSDQALPVLTRLTRDFSGFGKTGDMGLCVLRVSVLHCFPQRLNPRAFETPLLNSAGEPLPMTRALRGETGTIFVRDYRNQNVIAAFGPVGNTGLGIVMKIDAAEVLRPIRDQLALALGVLLLLVGGGTLLLRSQIKPFAAKMVDAEALARMESQKFKGLLESAPYAIVIADRAGTIVLVNSQTEALFGYSRAELLGGKVELLLPERQRTGHRNGFFSEPGASPMGLGRDLHGRRKDGTEFPIEIGLSPMTTDEGVLASAAIRDISERKRFEETLKQKNLELENANRAKDRFLASMSHELRTPLNAIIGFTGTLLMKLPGPLNADQDKQLKTVQGSARLLLSLINDLLDLARIEAGKSELTLESTDCLTVVEEVAASLKPLALAKGLAFDVAMPDEPLTIRTDRRALRQIVLNLANNAIKFTERGSVRLHVERRVDGASRFVAIDITDTGMGIRAEDREKLFAPFAQLDSRARARHEGTGLGLHLSRKLAELLGGTIEFQSEFGRGSTFTLILPES